MEIQSPTTKMQAEVTGGIGWITFNAPERRNAMSLDMWQGLAEILRQMENEESLRVVVLKGAGDKAFVSGADISEFEEKRSSQEDRDIYEAAFDEAHNRLANFPRPVVAMIQGFCVGGGLAIALNTDIRIATEDSVFGIPAAKLGLGYGFEAIKTLESIVGPSHAKDILFTARFLNTEEALRIGLVNFVVSRDELESTVSQYIERIAENAPLTIKAVKATVAEVVRDPGQKSPEYIAKLVNDCFLSEDYKEGRTAFLAKRKANFKGS
ncbi:MAG: enoyl-CoA hydratase [Gammaproteobacteria bacterium]|nr:enoyl-CoA hydratase [Gammaproteobacteria bacterium]MDD9894929.1 enoyl-CoA hydratase [Gammaproteobacteria bacterium]MDD9958815.1 enoyl-CoA hydratase [Gammaproteobacteria bacterium]